MRVLFLVENRMRIVFGHFGCRLGVALFRGAGIDLVAGISGSGRILGAEHLMNRLAFVHMAVQTVRNPFTEIFRRFSMKGFAIGGHCLKSEVVVPGDELGIIVAALAYLGNILGISCGVQARGDVVVEPENELILVVTNPAAP